MPNLHIIIGDTNTRKSSLLRCLTGIGSGNSKKYMDVKEASGRVITVYCRTTRLWLLGCCNILKFNEGKFFNFPEFLPITHFEGAFGDDFSY